MENSPDIREFIEFKNKADKFFKVVVHWETRMLFESINDKEFFTEISNIIEVVSNNIKPKDMEDIFNSNMKKSKHYLELSKKELDFDKKFNIAMRAMAYFGISEALNEFSSFSEKILTDIKEKYGEDYLKVVEDFDKKFLSIDGKKFLEAKRSNIQIDEVLEKYLIMKNVQDKQHYYYLEEIEPYIWKLEKEYLNTKSDLNIYNQTNAILLRALIEISSNKIIDIDDLSKYYISGIKDAMVKLVGGKAYGLAILNSLNIDIPKTYVLPVVSDFTREDLNIFQTNKKYAIRSSADIEDGETKSFAGMFDSFLNVDCNNILANIEKVKSSVNNPRVQSYIKQNNLSTQPKMAVVIQEFEEPEFSGVWIGNSRESGMLEWVEGNGEKLVSGKVTPNNEVWIDGKCNISDSIKIENYPIGKKLIYFQKSILEADLHIADFEWCVLKDKLLMLQYRPTTVQLSINPSTETNVKTDNKNDVFYGIAASGGEIKHVAKFVNITRASDKDAWNDGDIMMAWFTDPEWMDVMIRSSAIVTAMGGFLCHSAIIARELGIPCVTGIGGEAMKKIWHEKFIYVNGTKGEVRKVQEATC